MEGAIVRRGRAGIFACSVVALSEGTLFSATGSCPVIFSRLQTAVRTSGGRPGGRPPERMDLRTSSTAGLRALRNMRQHPWSAVTLPAALGWVLCVARMDTLRASAPHMILWPSDGRAVCSHAMSGDGGAPCVPFGSVTQRQPRYSGGRQRSTGSVSSEADGTAPEHRVETRLMSDGRHVRVRGTLLANAWCVACVGLNDCHASAGSNAVRASGIMCPPDLHERCCCTRRVLSTVDVGSK